VVADVENCIGFRTAGIFEAIVAPLGAREEGPVFGPAPTFFSVGFFCFLADLLFR
jgi:hypothetical protein